MANSAVHTGFWIDYSRSSSVLGATLTLDANWGSQLVSAAAIVVQIIGFSAWTIVAFAIHQRRAVSGLRDEYDAQLQVLLRNTQAADSTSWSIFSLGRTWRGRKQKVWRSAAPLSLLPALLYIAFIVAGVFVGQIASNSYDRSDVLVQPGACGYLAPPESTKEIIGFNNLNINISSIAKQYALSCYGGGAGSISAVSCNTYTVPYLKYRTYFDQACPIPGGNACFPLEDENARPIRLETAALDSHYDLGINAPSNQRLTFQYQATCAPLSYSFVDSFTVSQTVSKNTSSFGTPPGNATYQYYEFGPFYQFDADLTTRFLYAPIVRYWGAGNLGYTINSARSYVPHDDPAFSAWQPVAPLNQTTGDLTLLMLTPNSITYTAPVKDPMFRTGSSPDPELIGGAQYIPSRAAYFMACSETFQICNPVNDRCTGWNASVNLADHRSYWHTSLDLNEQQRATFSRMSALAFDNSIFTATNGQTDPVLAQMYLLSQTGSRKLPDDQWHREVQGWFETVLARSQLVQTVFVDTPLDLVHQANVEFQQAETFGKALAQQCKQQRVTAPARYQSYNLFALVLIAFFGVVIPLIAVMLKSSHAKLWRVNPKGHRYLSYQAEELMQLHRMAMEGNGYDGWEGGLKKTPRTGVAQERIPQVILDDDDGEREPVLRYPKSGLTRREGVNGHSRKGGYEEVGKEDDSDSVIR